mmetsp:Transcript_1240/g.2266  ORF Transcript_1240/g.2266 Transcript_1240/m.2266 type:complete len:114 (-) Transcript_1240:145-486(-)
MVAPPLMLAQQTRLLQRDRGSRSGCSAALLLGGQLCGTSALRLQKLRSLLARCNGLVIQSGTPHLPAWRSNDHYSRTAGAMPVWASDDGMIPGFARMDQCTVYRVYRCVSRRS